MKDTTLTIVAAYFDKKEILYVSPLQKVDVNTMLKECQEIFG